MRTLVYLVTNLGIGGSILAMIQFAKYCRRLNQSWAMEPEEMERCQAKARRCLAAAGCLLGAAFLAMFLSAFLA